MFKIKKVKPLFTGIITTAKTYVGDQTTKGGLLLDGTRRAGELNCYQTVLAVGEMCKDVKEGDIVKLNYKRYLRVDHNGGMIDKGMNKQYDKMNVVYEIPKIEMNEQDCLFLQSADIEYIVEDYDVDEGGLLQ